MPASWHMCYLLILHVALHWKSFLLEDLDSKPCPAPIQILGPWKDYEKGTEAIRSWLQLCLKTTWMRERDTVFVSSSLGPWVLFDIKFLEFSSMYIGKRDIQDIPGSRFKLAGEELQFFLKICLNLYLLLCGLLADFLLHPRSWAVPQSLFSAGPVEKTGQNEPTSLTPIRRRKHKEVREKNIAWAHLGNVWAREKGLNFESDHLQFSKLWEPWPLSQPMLFPRMTTKVAELRALPAMDIASREQTQG